MMIGQLNEVIAILPLIQLRIDSQDHLEGFKDLQAPVLAKAQITNKG